MECIEYIYIYIYIYICNVYSVHIKCVLYIGSNKAKQRVGTFSVMNHGVNTSGLA